MKNARSTKAVTSAPSLTPIFPPSGTMEAYVLSHLLHGHHIMGDDAWDGFKTGLESSYHFLNDPESGEGIGINKLHSHVSWLKLHYGWNIQSYSFYTHTPYGRICTVTEYWLPYLTINAIPGRDEFIESVRGAKWGVM